MDASSRANLVDHVKNRLRFQEWRGRNRFDRALFICNYTVANSTLPDWIQHRQRRLHPVWVKADIREALLAARSVERDSTPVVPPLAISTIWTRVEQPDVMVRIDVLECTSRDDAHECIVRIVADFESPLVIELPGPLGDVAFSGGGGGLILFARANLVYLLRNVGRRATSLETIALSLDAAAIPTPGGGLATPPAQALRAPTAESDDAIVEVALEDATASERKGCWTYTSPVGDFLMRDRRVYFRGPVSGVHQITIHREGGADG